MEQQEHIFRPGQRVRLKSGRDEPYKWAAVGSEAIVKEVVKDDFGYPMAYVEWDKDHWTYNGEEDRWVFQSHFDPVGDPPMDEKKDLTPEDQAKLMEFLKGMGFSYNGGAPEPEEPSQDEQDKEYAEYVDYAEKAMADSEAFLTIAIRRTEEKGVPMLVPQVVAHHRTELGQLAIDAQLATLLTMSHTHFVEQAMARILDEKGDK